LTRRDIINTHTQQQSKHILTFLLSQLNSKMEFSNISPVNKSGDHVDGGAALQAGIVSYIVDPTPPEATNQLDTSTFDLALERFKLLELHQITFISTSYD
jgi:hypothetical protein